MFVVVMTVLGLVAGFAVDAVVDRIPAPQDPSARRRAVILIGNGALWGLAAHEFSHRLVLVPYLLFFSMLLAVSVIDIQLLRIPDRIVFPTLAISIVLIIAITLKGSYSNRIIEFALGGAFGYFVVLFVPHLISPRGMGFGDVKLAAVMGLYLGWLAGSWIDVLRLVFYAVLIGAVLGVVLGTGVAIVRRKMRQHFPFGPALALGAVVVVLNSQTLIAR